MPGQLVLGHAHQQSDKLGRFGEVVLAGGRADEKAGQNRLADVRGIQLPLTARDPSSEFAPPTELPTRRAHQLLGGLGIAAPDCAQELREVRSYGHGPALRSRAARSAALALERSR